MPLSKSLTRSNVRHDQRGEATTCQQHPSSRSWTSFDRVIGTQDLYGFLTSRNSVKDLVLGQKTAVTAAQIKDLLRAKYIERTRPTRCWGSVTSVSTTSP